MALASVMRDTIACLAVAKTLYPRPDGLPLGRGQSGVRLLFIGKAKQTIDSGMGRPFAVSRRKFDPRVPERPN
jgi:hypothetical protein